MRNGLSASPPLVQLIVLIAAGIVSMGLLLGVYMLGLSVAGVDLSFVSNLGRISDPFGLEATSLKVLQIIQAIGLFVVPYLIYRQLDPSPRYSLRPPSSQWKSLLVFALVMVAALPVINFLAEWNAQLQLPEGLASIQDWIAAREKDVEALLEVFLVMESPWHLVMNVLLIALIPAISEEVFFRGSVQPLLLKMVKNHHLAIWLTAFLFSFFHMQFLGFVPRMILGAVFGYAAHWSGSLIFPVVAHFINNALAVTISYLIGKAYISDNLETIGGGECEWGMVALSVLALGAGMTFVYQRRSRSTSSHTEIEA